jgi:precorrin-2 dehydrogenase/sirohydrochlorin ferrochelatase|tara:strand:+ start:959 stop:1618 length:660 start_codon:yes stop_codon:yes gene_type:complete
MTDLNPLFQVGLDVRHRICLVIGGNDEAEDKCGRLLEAGARVVLIATELTPTLTDWATQQRLQWRRRGYEAGDLDDAFLVMNTVRGGVEFCTRLFADAESLGVLVNTYDDIDHSHFGMGALVSAGPLRLSVSTSNASPTLSARLRSDLERLFEGDFSAYLKALGQARAHLKEVIPDFPTRRQILHGLVEGARLEGCFHVPVDWRERIDAVLALDTKKPG